MPNTVRLSLPASPGVAYDIHIGPGLLDSLGQHVRQVAPATQAVLVSDDHVAALYARHACQQVESAGYRVSVVTIRPGDHSKSLDVLAMIYDAALTAQVDRRTPVVALGGGVVGDLAGFAAATLLRGLPFVQVPTSLEAAVDASVGGKTGLNHVRGKNLIGAFHQPSVVIHDTQTLATLPVRDLRAALAESVKHAVIADAAFLHWHEVHASTLGGEWSPAWSALADELVARNVRIKADMVQRDEREAGPRALLNFGHTIGHAIEAQCLANDQLPTLRHGEAVAIGIVAATHLATARGRLTLAEGARITSLLGRLNLPTAAPPGMDRHEVMRALPSDKKAVAGRARFVLPAGIGQAEVVADISDAEVHAALDAIEVEG